MDSKTHAFDYLRAIDELGLGVRVMPVGMARFDVPPWNEVSHTFVSPIGTDYINVVCVPSGVKLGAPVSMAQFGPGTEPFSSIGGQGNVYEPEGAIAGLYTVGVPNVAILVDKDFTPGELDALRLYDMVVCPSPELMIPLRQDPWWRRWTPLRWVIKRKLVPMIPPTDPDQLSRLFSGMTPA
jgi:hypothetical protein